MKKVFLMIALIGFGGSLFAQSAEDALIYSQTFYTGTARSAAMGGAFGALGADLSVAATNPAGLGLFRYSEFSITPTFNFNTAHSLYNGVGMDNNNANFGFDNLGFVSALKLGAKSHGWKYIQLAAGMNKVNNFHSSITMQGPNATNSRLDVYLNDANGINYQDIANNTNNNYSFYLQPAWDLYLIDTITGSPNTYNQPFAGANLSQQLQKNTFGAVNQWFFSVSANYNNVLYVGATIGLNALKYTSQSDYSEVVTSDNLSPHNWGVNERVETSGTGINLKLGAIVQPADWIRVGFAFHTPTYYWNMNDTWQTKTYVDPRWTSPNSVFSPVGSFNYTLTTPWKILGDVGIIIGKRGSVSAEYEHVDYPTMKFHATDYGFSTENSNIKSYYKAQNNVRFGTEWRFGNTNLRAGYAYYGSPYANNLNDGSRNVISGGIGFHFGNYALDLAYVHAIQKQDYYLYSIVPNPANNTYKYNSYLVSLSYRF